MQPKSSLSSTTYSCFKASLPSETYTYNINLLLHTVIPVPRYRATLTLCFSVDGLVGDETACFFKHFVYMA